MDANKPLATGSYPHIAQISDLGESALRSRSQPISNQLFLVPLQSYLGTFIKSRSQGFFASRPFLKMAGGIVLGSVAVSAVSAVSADVLPYISVAIKASFLKLGMYNICKNNIVKMFLDFFKILNCSFDRRFLNFW